MAPSSVARIGRVHDYHGGLARKENVPSIA
jgi:hypothetical protein